MNEDCKKCFRACKKPHDNRKYINKVLISHNRDCNASCVFCYNNYDDHIKYEKYEILPQLERLKEYFKYGCEMHFGGGEPTIWEDFDDIIDFAIREKFVSINIASNGSRFSQKLADAMKLGLANVVFTTDTANPLIYKNLKGLDFDSVVTNIEKYLEYDISRKLVQNKYVIIPNINDDEEIIRDWVDFNEDLGIRKLAFDVEVSFFSMNRKDISPRYPQLIEFAQKLTKEKGMECILYSFAQQMMHDREEKKSFFGIF